MRVVMIAFKTYIVMMLIYYGEGVTDINKMIGFTKVEQNSFLLVWNKEYTENYLKIEITVISVVSTVTLNVTHTYNVADVDFAEVIDLQKDSLYRVQVRTESNIKSNPYIIKTQGDANIGCYSGVYDVLFVLPPKSESLTFSVNAATTFDIFNGKHYVYNKSKQSYINFCVGLRFKDNEMLWTTPRAAGGIILNPKSDASSLKWKYDQQIEIKAKVNTKKEAVSPFDICNTPASVCPTKTWIKINGDKEVYAIGFDKAPYVGWSRKHDVWPKRNFIVHMDAYILGEYRINTEEAECYREDYTKFEEWCILMACPAPPQCGANCRPHLLKITDILVDEFPSCLTIYWNITLSPDYFSLEVDHFEIEYKVTPNTNGVITDVDNDNREVKVCGLTYYTRYDFILSAVGTTQNTEKDEFEFITPDGAPFQSVNAIEIIPESFSIKVIWEDLDDKLFNGSKDNGQYIIRYRQNGTSDFIEYPQKASIGISAIIGNLKPYSVYEVNVIAETSVSRGPLGESIFEKTKSHYPLASPSSISSWITSSTCLWIEWEDIEDELWAGIPHGFKVLLNDVQLININYPNTSANVTDLEPFTNYTIKLLGYNDYGDGNYSIGVVSQTDEEPPDFPPPDLSYEVIAYNEIALYWSTIDLKKIKGALRSFTILYTAIYDENDLKMNRETTTNRKRRSLEYTEGLILEEQILTVTNITEESTRIQNLFGNTKYNISMRINDKYDGVYSPSKLITTVEHVPMISAFEFETVSNHRHQIKTSWKHSPPAYLQGVRISYTMRYQRIGTTKDGTVYDTTKEVLDPDMHSYVLGFLRANTDYKIWMTASTAEGEGNSTTIMKCRTLEGVPLNSPTNFSAVSHERPHSIKLTWLHIDEEQWEGEQLGYQIRYKILSVGGVAYTIAIQEIKDIGYVEEYLIEGLTVYTKYEIMIAARTNKGPGVFSKEIIIDTCRVPRPDMVISYIVKAPYVNFRNSSITSARPSGIMIASFEETIRTCAYLCKTFTEEVSFTYNELSMENSTMATGESVNNSTNETVKATNMPDSDFLIPQRMLPSFSPLFVQVPVVKTVAYVLVEVPKTAAGAIQDIESGLLKQIVIMIPVCGLYFLINGIFGGIFWLFEPTHVVYNGHGKGLAGLFEGLYLAVMTSTTVGYGDKVPQTGRGRLYIFFWTLLGLALTGIVAGSLTSALSVATINNLGVFLPAEKVTALYQSPEYFYALKKFTKLDKDTKYYTYEEVLQPLIDKRVRYAIMDQNVVEVMKPILKLHGLEIKTTYNVVNYLGFSMYSEFQALQYCAMNETVINNYLIEDELNDLRMRVALEVDAVELPAELEVEEEAAPPPISIEAPIFQKTMFWLIGLLLFAFLLGTMYEIIRRLKERKRKNKILTKIEQKELQYKELMCFYKNVLDDFKATKEYIKETADDIFNEHGEELLYLRNEISKVVGVDFQFVKINDLALPMRDILARRDEEERKRRKRK